MSCLTCHYFIELTEDCTLANPPRKPPARVIAYGCPAWKNTNDQDLEHHVRSGNLNFQPKPLPAKAAPGGTYRIDKSPRAYDLDAWNDDISF